MSADVWQRISSDQADMQKIEYALGGDLVE